MLTFGSFVRPDRLQVAKGLDYHANYAKYCISTVSQNNYIAFVQKSLINWAFYKGNQWIFNEDLDPFLMDESGGARNRIKFVQNIVRPFVEYYTGSAIRLDISARAESITSQAIDRKEMALQKMKTIQAVANHFPAFEMIAKQNYHIGEDDFETEAIFNNLYKDKFVEEINGVMQHLAERNDIEDKKPDLARHMALDGIAILKEYERFGTQAVDLINPRMFFFDETARRADLKDAAFMGEWKLSDVADITERYPNLSYEDLTRIEKGSAMTMGNIGLHNYFWDGFMRSNGKTPEYEVYWRDIETDVWGAIYDEFGNPKLEKIDGEKYTDKDLIPKKDLKPFVEENFWIEKVLKMENKAKVPLDVVRFCNIIPSEYLNGEGGGNDIILDCGIRPYQTRYSYNYQFPDFPYKVRCWAYHAGEISAPIDDIISPQRFINRMLSMGESHINNLRGSGTIIDEDAAGGRDNEDTILRDMNMGKPVLVQANGNVQNAVATYGNSIGQGTLQLFQVAENMKKMADNIIGGGDSLMGQGGAYRASATVASQNLNQGTTMQEPVFYAISKIILDMYQSFANRGRRILCANQNRLTVAVGDSGLKDIMLTREFEAEEFRITIERSNNPQQEKQAANDTLLILLEKQLIDRDTFAKYFNRATIQSVGMAIREYTAKLIEAERAKQKQDMAQNQKEVEAMKASQQLNNSREDLALAQGQQMKQPTTEEASQPSGTGDAKLVEALLQQNPMQKQLQ